MEQAKQTTNRVAGIYGISLSEMVDRITYAMEFAFFANTDAPTRVLRLQVIEFMQEKGEEAVISMYGFIRYAQTTIKEDAEKGKVMREVLAHDINGRAEKFMLPRSSPYKEFANI